MTMTAEHITEASRARRLLDSGDAKSIRVTAGVSLGEAADALGVSPATLWRWENHHRRPRAEAAVRLGLLLRDLEAVVRDG